PASQPQWRRGRRAGGPRYRTLAVGADPGPLLLLSIPRALSRTSQLFPLCAAAPLPTAHIGVGPRTRRRSRRPRRPGTEPSKYQRLIEGDGQWRLRELLLAQCRPEPDG